MQLERNGAGPEARRENVNAVEIYKDMLMPKGADPKRFDDALSIDKSLVWQQLADEFSAVNAVAMHESVADEAEVDADSKQDARIRGFEAAFDGRTRHSAES
jgi:hypothetical protein